MVTGILSSRAAVALPVFVLTVGLLPLGFHSVYAQQIVPEPPTLEGVMPAGEESEPEQLLRGPLHEAFAEPVAFNPGPTLIVSKQPPEPIDEMPPETKPEGDVTWIPGYWAWDDTLDDFIWISGVYREAPPNRRWVPGYWQKVDTGYQWISGFWAPLEADDVGYLPQPPESVEHGPSSPAPSDDYFWVNGSWRYDGRYYWRSGYWARGYDDWVWVPDHYVWTPRGCIFVAGYWDYQLSRRGTCFAPVYWRNRVYLRPGYYYRPYYAIDLLRLPMHLFVRPGYCHYYFGDWYGLSGRFGIYSPSYFHGRFGYDPLWTYYGCYFGRRGVDYAARMRGWHQYFERHEGHRPPHTWKDQKRFAERHRDFKHLGHSLLGEDVREVASKHPDKFQRIGDDARQRMRDHAKATRNLADVRRGGERERRGGEKFGGDAQRQRLRLPETPEVRQSRERTAVRGSRGDGQWADGGRLPGRGGQLSEAEGRRDMRPREGQAVTRPPSRIERQTLKVPRDVRPDERRGGSSYRGGDRSSAGEMRRSRSGSNEPQRVPSSSTRSRSGDEVRRSSDGRRGGSEVRRSDSGRQGGGEVRRGGDSHRSGGGTARSSDGGGRRGDSGSGGRSGGRDGGRRN